jgi:hypothetical protein
MHLRPIVATRRVRRLVGAVLIGAGLVVVPVACSSSGSSPTDSTSSPGTGLGDSTTTVAPGVPTQTTVDNPSTTEFQQPGPTEPGVTTPQATVPPTPTQP